MKNFFQEDEELNSKSEINNSPHNLENVEIFYKPIQDCKRFDCPMCLPIQKFLDAHRRANKKVKDWFLVGLRFDHPEAIRYDNLKSLQELTRIANTLFNVIALNDATNFDRWSRLLDELDN